MKITIKYNTQSSIGVIAFNFYKEDFQINSSVLIVFRLASSYTICVIIVRNLKTLTSFNDIRFCSQVLFCIALCFNVCFKLCKHPASIEISVSLSFTLYNTTLHPLYLISDGRQRILKEKASHKIQHLNINVACLYIKLKYHY